MDTSKPVKVFYSYSHKDETFRDELETHLSILKRQGKIDSWHDQCILAGQELDRQIDTNLQTADIILLLVSADFINSNYCYETEMKAALEKHSNKEAIVIPIIIRSVEWSDGPIGKLLALPTDGKAVSSWIDRDEAWKNVAQGIKKVVKSIHDRQTTDNPQPLRVADTPINSDRLDSNLVLDEKQKQNNVINFNQGINNGIVTNSLEIKTQDKVIKINPINGSIGSSLNHRNYVKYLIDRYHEFKLADVGKKKMKYIIIYNAIKREFGAKWDMISLDKFERLLVFVQKRINSAILGKNQNAKNIKCYSTFEEFLRK